MKTEAYNQPAEEQHARRTINSRKPIIAAKQMPTENSPYAPSSPVPFKSPPLIILLCCSSFFLSNLTLSSFSLSVYQAFFLPSPSYFLNLILYEVVTCPERCLQ